MAAVVVVGDSAVTGWFGVLVAVDCPDPVEVTEILPTEPPQPAAATINKATDNPYSSFTIFILLPFLAGPHLGTDPLARQPGVHDLPVGQLKFNFYLNARRYLSEHGL